MTSTLRIDTKGKKEAEYNNHNMREMYRRKGYRKGEREQRNLLPKKIRFRNGSIYLRRSSIIPAKVLRTQVSLVSKHIKGKRLRKLLST